MPERPPAGSVLLPQRWRRAVAVLSVLATAGVVGLGRWYAGGRTAGPVDAAIAGPLIAGGQSYESLLWPVADLGGAPAFPLGVGILLVAALRAGRRQVAVLAVAGPVLASVCTELVLKPVVDRTHYGGLSLPSGHATSITAQVTVFLLGFVAAGLPARTWLRRGLVALGGAVVLGVCGAVVSLERHYPTDTVAGVLVGGAVVGALALLLDLRTRVRARTRQHVFRPAEEGLPRHPG